MGGPDWEKTAQIGNVFSSLTVQVEPDGDGHCSQPRKVPRLAVAVSVTTSPETKFVQIPAGQAGSQTPVGRPGTVAVIVPFPFPFLYAWTNGGGHEELGGISPKTTQAEPAKPGGILHVVPICVPGQTDQPRKGKVGGRGRREAPSENSSM